MMFSNLIYLFAFVGSCSIGDAAIYNWTTPVIGSRTGNGSLAVPENQALATAFFALKANGAAPISYQILTYTTPFNVTTAGLLYITEPLDYEEERSHVIRVRAVDRNQTSGTATITISVRDVNERPEFESDVYSPCIVDGSGAGTVIAVVSATDEDDDEVTHKLTGGNTNSVFTIDKTTGVIEVSAGMFADKCAGRSYGLVVTADDGYLTVASYEDEIAKLKTEVMILKGKHDFLLGSAIPPEMSKLKENVSENVADSKVSADKKDIGKTFEDFSETLKQISEAGFDKQLVLKLLQEHVQIISTRCYHELASVITHQSQQIHQILSGIVGQKAVFEVKRFMGDVADIEPAEIKVLRSISTMLQPKEKDHLIKFYELTKDDRQVLEDGSVPFLLVLLQKEHLRSGKDKTLVDFLRSCLTEIGRSDLWLQFYTEIAKYKQEEKSMDAKIGQKSHTKAEVMHQKKDREYILDDMARDMKLLMKDMEKVKSAIIDLPKTTQFDNVANMKSEHFKHFYETSFRPLYQPKTVLE